MYPKLHPKNIFEMYFFSRMGDGSRGEFRRPLRGGRGEMCVFGDRGVLGQPPIVAVGEVQCCPGRCL